MKLKKFAKGFGPLLGLVLAASLSGCDGVKASIDGENMTFNGTKGKKLAELDLTGAAPTELALLGPDEVQVTLGDKLAITVEGDSAVQDRLRFALDGNSLGILRDGKWNSDDGVAIVRITMPAPREVAMLGSGKIVTPALANNAEVVVAGSGQIESGAVSGEKLEVTIPGSGRFRANGSTDQLELTILGSGAAELDALRVQKAEVTMAGSGRAAFSSDGDVEATILGSGEVVVRGRARCKLNSVGSGRLVCENGTSSGDWDAGDTPPTPPTPPSPPTPPTPEAK